MLTGNHTALTPPLQIPAPLMQTRLTKRPFATDVPLVYRFLRLFVLYRRVSAPSRSVTAPSDLPSARV